ncbi:murein biosynthesis integral membrane protein MurJ [Sulfurospirillum arcachonense]|uniref:murein biosynthesis integral membrane protein MurJ n=1 Tax=Sulfurospirillum arcachonense TaxID=57666 RepID=UPI000468C340|nr:murein biosynthesis integral membrane protein MurJ [Sulfurospirillum arcachonense]
MIFKNFFTNSIGILISRIFGLIRDLLTASVLGANIYSDIFFVAFKLPNLFRRIFAEGAFTQSFIPSFIKSSNKSIFTYKTFIKFLFFLLFLSFIVTIFSGFFAKLIALGFDDETLKLASPLVAINFYYLPLIFSVTFLGSLLQYKNHFATTAFSTALLNIALISSLLLTNGMDKKTIVYAMSYAVIIGGCLQLFTHIIAIKNRNLLKLFQYGYTSRSKKQDKIKDEEKLFFKSFSHAILGNSTPQISAFLDTWIASFLLTGSISYLYYANRVFQLPLALFAIALSVGIFPKIARLIKNNDIDDAQILFKNGFWFLFFLLSLSAIGGFILSEEIIKILFQRGAFSLEDTKNSAEVLQMYLIGLVPYGLSKLFSLWLYASHKQKEAAKISLFALSANVILYAVFVQPLGVKGLALASSCAGFVLLIFTIRSFSIKKFLDIIIDKKLAIFVGLILFYIPTLLYFKEIINEYL